MKYEWDLSLLDNYTSDKDMDKTILEMYLRKYTIFDVNECLPKNPKKNFLEDFDIINNHNYLFSVFKEYNNICNDFKKIKINDLITDLKLKESLEMTNSFYNSLKDSEIKNIFNSIFAKKDGRIKERNPIFYTYFTAQTINIQNKDYFIDIISNHNLIDTSSLIHEFGHCIGNNLQKSNLYYNSIFDEIESMFMELISYDYFAKNKSLKLDANQLKNRYFNYLDKYIKLAYSKYIIQDYFNYRVHKRRFKNYSFSQIKKIIQDEFNVKSDQSKKLYKTPIKEDLSYIISLLISIELYYIYKQDEEKALDLYKKIIKLDSKDIYKFYEIKKLGLNPNSHINTFYKSLKR